MKNNGLVSNTISIRYLITQIIITDSNSSDKTLEIVNQFIEDPILNIVHKIILILKFIIL